MRIAVPKALCVLREYPRPRPKIAKVRHSDTRPGDVCERAERSEGSNSAPHPKYPCFAVQAAVCDPSPKAECVPTFACESKRGPFVGDVEKRNEERLGDKIYGGNFAGFFSLLIVGFTENREMYVYKSPVESSGITERFHWQRKAPLWSREGWPVFRRVSACVRSFSESRVCTRFRRESERGPFVREAEKRDEKRFGTALWR